MDSPRNVTVSELARRFRTFNFAETINMALQAQGAYRVSGKIRKIDSPPDDLAPQANDSGKGKNWTRLYVADDTGEWIQISVDSVRYQELGLKTGETVCADGLLTAWWYEDPKPSAKEQSSASQSYTRKIGFSLEANKLSREAPEPPLGLKGYIERQVLEQRAVRVLSYLVLWQNIPERRNGKMRSAIQATRQSVRICLERAPGLRGLPKEQNWWDDIWLEAFLKMGSREEVQPQVSCPWPIEKILDDEWYPQE